MPTEHHDSAHSQGGTQSPVIARYRFRFAHWVEAFRYQDEFPLAFLRDGESVRSAGTDDAAIVLDTPEGAHRAEVGDWIVRGVGGDLHPCKPDIFDARYEAA